MKYHVIKIGAKYKWCAESLSTTTEVVGVFNTPQEAYEFARKKNLEQMVFKSPK